jgi:hypothetical protein
LAAVTLPGYRPLRNRSNNWGFDPAEQQNLTFTGMGLDINVHDQWAVESMGRVQDRTVEHLGVADRAISANRRLLLAALDDQQAGRPLPTQRAHGAAGSSGPPAVDTVGPTAQWRDHWLAREQSRRRESPWAPPTTSAAADGAG